MKIAYRVEGAELGETALFAAACCAIAFHESAIESEPPIAVHVPKDTRLSPAFAHAGCSAVGGGVRS